MSSINVNSLTSSLISNLNSVSSSTTDDGSDFSSIMLDTLDEAERKPPKKPTLAEFTQEVTTAVSKGLITQTEADQAISFFKSMEDVRSQLDVIMQKIGVSTTGKPPSLEEIKAQLAAAVSNGLITQAEADQAISFMTTLGSLKTQMDTIMDKVHTHHHKHHGAHKVPSTDEIKSDISNALKKGTITQEEADKALQALDLMAQFDAIIKKAHSTATTDTTSTAS